MVASIGIVAITESDVEKEFRLGRLLNSQPIEAQPDAADLAQARDRLVHQWLLTGEAEAEGIERGEFAQPAAQALEEVRRKYPSEDEFQSALLRVGMSEHDLLRRLEDQRRTLRLIDQRLRPAAWVEPAEIRAYYDETFAPEFARRNSAVPPSLEEVESQIREILVEKEIDELLESWLEELRTSRGVRIHSAESSAQRHLDNGVK